MAQHVRAILLRHHRSLPVPFPSPLTIVMGALSAEMLPTEIASNSVNWNCACRQLVMVLTSVYRHFDRPTSSRHQTNRSFIPCSIERCESDATDRCCFFGTARRARQEQQPTLCHARWGAFDVLGIATMKLTMRPGRIEPRAKKRRPKPLPLLTIPRQTARENIITARHARGLS